MIDPRQMTVKDWTAQNTAALTRLGAPAPVLFEDSGWQQWALVVMQSAAISQYKPPDPMFYSNWKDWAIRFNQAVPL